MDSPDGDPLDAVNGFPRFLARDQLIRSDRASRRDVESVRRGEAGLGCHAHGIFDKPSSNRGPDSDPLEEFFVKGTLLDPPMKESLGKDLKAKERSGSFRIDQALWEVLEPPRAAAMSTPASRKVILKDHAR